MPHVMAQLGKDKKHNESLEDIIHDGGAAEQTVEAKEKKKKNALFGSSGRKKDKPAESRSERLTEEELKREEASMYVLLSAKLSEKAELDVELESVKDELRKEKEEKEKLMIGQLEMSDHLAKVEAELKRCQEEDALLAMLATKLREKASLKDQLEAAKDQMEKERVCNLQRVTEMDARLKAEQEEMEGLKQKLSEMEGELREKEDEKLDLEMEVKRERDEKALLMEQLSLKETELKSIKEEKTMLWSELRKVQHEKILQQQGMFEGDSDLTHDDV